MGEAQPHVVILGGGFAGLYAARSLKRQPVRVTLVDRRNHHLFQPLLYQVATAGLAASEIAEPIRKIVRRQRNATVLLGDALRIDPERRRVVLRDGELGYDRLIVATGSTHNYFGHDEWAEHAPGLKSLEDAFEIRRRVLLAFEHAERESDPERRRSFLTFVVVGAGATGVELAGALREIAQRTLARDFRRFDPRETRVILIDAADRVLPGFPDKLSRRAREMLERLGVEVRTDCPVTDVGPDGVKTAPAFIPARTVLWAAGVRASPLARSLGAELDGQGRVKVAPDLSVPGHPDVLVAGDLAALDQDGQPVPGTAPAAIQEGRHAAANIARDLRGEPRRPFRYKDRGVLATVGKKAGVARIDGLQLAGFAAWVAWLVVHIVWLIGFRNRLAVLFQWAWAYFTYQRSSRVIVDLETGRTFPEEARAGSPPEPPGAAAAQE